jgi:hypothetical protein
MPRSNKVEATTTTNKAPESTRLELAIKDATAGIAGDNELSMKSATTVADAQGEATQGRQDSAELDAKFIATLRRECLIQGTPLTAMALDIKTGNKAVRELCETAIQDKAVTSLMAGKPLYGRSGQPLRQWTPTTLQHIKKYKNAAIRKFAKQGKHKSFGLAQSVDWLWDLAVNTQKTGSVEHLIHGGIVEFCNDERRRIQSVMEREETAIQTAIDVAARRAQRVADKRNNVKQPTKEENAFAKRIEQAGKALDAAVLRLRDMEIPDGYDGPINFGNGGQTAMVNCLLGFREVIDGKRAVEYNPETKDLNFTPEFAAK